MARLKGRCPRCGWKDKKIFRKTAIKRSLKNQMAARGGNYN